MAEDGGNTESAEPPRRYRLMAYGLDRLSMPTPVAPIQARNFTIEFEPFKSPRRFNEFDCVIVFQGLFESFRSPKDGFSSRLIHDWDRNELDKRSKEASLLLDEGGFLCFLLTHAFIDHADGHDFETTDLTKRHLNYQRFSRKNLTERYTRVRAIENEFKRFFDLFGATTSYFENYNPSLDLRTIAKAGQAIVGMIIDGREYFLPVMPPVPQVEKVTEFFEMLGEALTAVHNKRSSVIPDWVASFRFAEESANAGEREKLMARVAAIDSRQSAFDRYKGALVHTGSDLVRDVSAILEDTLGLKVTSADEYREDLKVLGADGKPVCVCEVKGLNRGVGREHINQTDSHRERSGFTGTFPAILVANTNIKSARTIQEKDQSVANEQVVHAVRNSVLVVRTLDLLWLLRLTLDQRIAKDQVGQLLFTNAGWLRVDQDGPRVLNGTEGAITPPAE